MRPGQVQDNCQLAQGAGPACRTRIDRPALTQSTCANRASAAGVSAGLSSGTAGFGDRGGRFGDRDGGCVGGTAGVATRREACRPLPQRVSAGRRGVSSTTATHVACRGGRVVCRPQRVSTPGRGMSPTTATHVACRGGRVVHWTRVSSTGTAVSSAPAAGVSATEQVCRPLRQACRPLK